VTVGDIAAIRAFTVETSFSSSLKSVQSWTTTESITFSQFSIFFFVRFLIFTAETYSECVSITANADTSAQT
jgi:hypothetical protein